ncbi:aminotransferase-like domain-containing protein [Dyadobacter sandarakinus]|uniref:PLP-dependent aminotransferase family protein n=1 Tax=Dyadobacter sandarakinus TaxID=2747268 RepID=A0ABX7I2I9_9BACT|nr:PLP-dependent aminotransferase family protein [Dyadobacter sandarakinus]QRR00044.1 PLP-dependent aminotransferase family protein [Dyadobacter sandarakinus]
MLRPWKLEIRIDHQLEKAVYLQIADAIISDIQLGRLKIGEALPGSRNLAEMLGVNRNTILEALNVLLNEEWIISKERKGTFVAETLPDFSNQRKTDDAPPHAALTKKQFRITSDDGYPDSKIAPVTELARAYRQIFNRNARWQMMGYSNEYGNADFIDALVQMLNHQRGMKVRNNALCVTRGSQMAMYLAAQCLCKKGDLVMVESPGYQPAWKAFEAAGATLLPVRVDQEGLMISDVMAHLKSSRKIRAIYTTPHHQYPTTVTLNLQRRLELIRLSNEYGFTIIEDDYDNEFHFGYRPVLPISSFKELKSYVYIGTMSKVVAPALRIGYLASSDPNLMEQIGSLRKIIDVQGDGIMEQAVLQLINDGTIKRHIRKATGYYKAKRDFTVWLLKIHLKDKANFTIPEGGLAFWIEPRQILDWSEISRKMASSGIKILTPDHFGNDPSINGIRVGYGSLSEKELKEVVMLLATHF